MGVHPGGLRGRCWGSLWQKLLTPASCSLTSLQIIFEGVRGSGYLGDIAIDDVTLKKGECPRKQMDPNKGANWEGGGGASSAGAVWVGTCLCQERVFVSEWGSRCPADGTCVSMTMNRYWCVWAPPWLRLWGTCRTMRGPDPALL